MGVVGVAGVFVGKKNADFATRYARRAAARLRSSHSLRRGAFSEVSLQLTRLDRRARHMPRSEKLSNLAGGRETSLTVQGPQDGPDQPRQHEGGSTKDILVIR
eukprot:scaffold87113_cov69-Phaeocystis_antarctica.AAC.1